MYSPRATSPNYGIAVLEQLLCQRATVRIHVRSLFPYVLFIYSVDDDSAVIGENSGDWMSLAIHNECVY